MTTRCPMGGRMVMAGSLVTCTDGDCRVLQYAATWDVKQAFLRRKMTRGELRCCPKCGVNTDLYHEGEPVCRATGCRVATFTGGLLEVPA